MKPIIIAVLGILLVTSAEFLPNKPYVTILNRDVLAKEHKLETYGAVDVAKLSHKPVYCSDYIQNYNWNKDVAYNVMMVESGNNARNLNDNPNTGDYSVGCFQINLLGVNQQAKYNLAVQLGYTGPNDKEALTEWLWHPGNNTAVAYQMWQGQGWAPWSNLTCKKVACY